MQSDPGLSVDNELGGALAARHLLSLGHRRLALVAGPDDWSEAGARRRGFEATLAGAGLEPVAVADGDWSADSGYDAFARIADASFTGAFCANDQMALGLLHAAADRGLSVPGELSVVGFDDVPESGHYLPPLTTVRQDFDVLGRRSIRSLVAQVEGTPVEYDAPVRPALIVRASTMTAPA
jgi:DNA-binding LacI/PurR family transcriptional regulator